MRWSRATTRKRPKFAAARTFFLSILVILVITALTLVTNGSHGPALKSENGWLKRREAAAYEGRTSAYIERAEVSLMRRDEAVRSKFPFYCISQ